MGGYSSEYEISIGSGEAVMMALADSDYDATQVLILKDRWVAVENGVEMAIDKNDFSFLLGDKKIIFDFGDIFKKKMFITNRKDLLIGDFLIDDRLANGAKNFQGELLRFGYDYERKIWNKYKDWHSILEKLL